LPCGVFDAVKNRFLPRILIGNFAAAKHIVLAGQGIGAALPFQLKREIDDGDCVLLPIELPWLSLNYGFISKRGRTHSPAAKAFMGQRQAERLAALRARRWDRASVASCMATRGCRRRGVGTETSVRIHFRLRKAAMCVRLFLIVDNPGSLRRSVEDDRAA
jgi:hypothetical protein